MSIDFGILVSASATLVAVCTFLITIYQERRLKRVGTVSQRNVEESQRGATPYAALYPHLPASSIEPSEYTVAFSNPPFGSLKLDEKIPAVRMDLLPEEDPLDFFEQVNSIRLEVDWRNAKGVLMRPNRFPDLAEAAA